MKALNYISNLLIAPFEFGNTIKLFRILVYAWFLIHAIIVYPIFDLVWGRQSLIMPIVNEPNLLDNLFFLLNYQGHMSWIVFILHVLASLLAMLGLLKWVPKLIVYLTAGILYYSGYLAFNGGFVLFWLFSFFLIFLDVKQVSPIRNVMNRMVMWSCIAQFLIVYGVAAFYKWTGSTWLDGTSVYYVTNIDHFTYPWVKDMLLGSVPLLIVFNYVGLFYQTLFPIMVWIRKTKYIFLMIGVCFHLYIMFAMGLFDFGLAMIIGYTLFFDENLSRNILKKVKLETDQSSDSTIFSTE